LQYKIEHDPAYADLIVDDDTLNGLPENGSVVDRLPVCQEGRQDGGAEMPVGPHAAAGNEDVKDTDDFGDVTVGGILDLGNPERPEIEQLCRGATEAIGGTCYWQTVVSKY
jgi:hypothetical protein